MGVLLGVFVEVGAGYLYKFCLQLAGQIPYKDAFPEHLQHPLPQQGDACFLRRLWEPIALWTGWQMCQADTWKYLLEPLQLAAGVLHFL